jgi:dihydropteroate synthase
MGILNVTPDSFSDGGKFFNVKQAVEHGLRMEREGADIIDIGGESTRPGSRKIPLDEELKRVIPVISKLNIKLKKSVISIDTYKGEVARAAIRAGAGIINDISGLRFDRNMKWIAAEHKVPVIIMHIKGTPRNMQKNPVYDDVVAEIGNYLEKCLAAGERAGIRAEQMVVDPGIGFGKTREHNLEIIGRLDELSRLGAPILVGPSRKSFIGLTLNESVQNRLVGTLAAVVASVLKGAHLVRVHDVKEARQAVKIADAIKRGE